MPPKKGSTKAGGAAKSVHPYSVSLPRPMQLLILALLSFALPVWAFLQLEDGRSQQLITAAAGVASLGFLVTWWLVPQVSSKRHVIVVTRPQITPFFSCRSER